MIIQADSPARIGKFVDGLPFVRKPFGINANYAAWMPSLGLVDTKGRNVTKVGTVTLAPSSENIVSSHSDSATNLIRVALPNSAIGTKVDGATLIAVFSLPSSYSATDKRIVALGSEQGNAGNTVFSIGTGASSASQLRVTAGGSDGTVSSETSGKSINDGQFHCAILSVWDFYNAVNGKYAAALDGSLVIPETSAGTSLGISNTYSSLVAGGFRRGGTDNAGATCNIALAMVVPIMSAAEIARVSGNPRMLFQPEDLFVWIPDAGGGGPAVLQGSAAGQVAATGALTTQIPLVGVATEASTATGSLTTQISLSGAAASVAVSSGVLTTTIKLSGAALAQVVASASMAGGAAALSGSAAQSATATGALTTKITLSGAAVAQALATAGLTTAPSGLAGSAAASASSTGALSTGIPLAGQASAIAIGAGGLTTSIKLAGAGAAVNSATGSLTVTSGFSAAALAQAGASGTLSTQIRLNAAAVMQALSAGSLSSGSTALQSDPRYTICLRSPRRAVASQSSNWTMSIQ